MSAAGASDDDAKLKVAGTLDHETRTSYALKLTVSSGTVSATGDVSISVTDVNEAPEIESAIPARPMETGDSEPVVVSPHFSDPDNDPLTYLAASSNREVATVSVSGSTVSVKGVAKGRADVTVTARDPGGKTASQSFRVTVTDPVPGNRAPVFGSAAFERSVAENSPGGAAVGDPVTAADPDGDTLSYALASGGDAGLFGIGASTGRITVAAGAVLDHEGAATHSVSVVASDGTLADTAAVTIKVADVPPPGRPAKPVVTGGDGQVTAMWKAPSNTGPAITGYDVRHRAASASGWTEASLGVVLEHTVTGLPAGTDHLVQVRAVSPEGAGEWSESGEGTTAAAANRAPAFASTAFERSVPEHSPAGTAVGAPVTATDVDGDTLSYALASGGDAALFAVGPRTGQLTVATDAVLDYEITATHSVSVVASDGALADTAKVTIRLTDVPPPGRLRKPFMRGAQGKVTATWTAPSNAGPAITGYDLGYRRDSAGGDWAEVSLGDVLKHAVTGLPAGTLYRVRLRAVSAEGAGAWSEPGRTGTSPRFDPASVTRSVPENSAAGTAVGAPVTAAAEEGVVLSYDFGGDGPPEFVIDGSSGQLKVAEGASLDYERGKRTYAVTVVAGYVADGDELADVAHVKIRVTDVPAPDKPDAPTVTGGTEQVTVSWSAPENEGPAITAYDLRYRAKGGGAWTDVSALGAVLADTIPGLEAGTTYEVQVRAISSEGTGAWSESGEGTTEAANRAPAFGVETHEREVPENSAADTAVGDPVTATDEDGDDLTYSLVSGDDGAPFEIDGTTGQITLASGAALDYESGNTIYAVSVRATDGTLADTAAVTIRVTDVPAPGQPNAPTVTGGTEQVAVSWSAPANEGPAITGYEIRYRSKADSAWTVPASLGVVLSSTISDLDSGTTYEVQVRAVSSEGAGEWSDSGEGTTEAANRAPSFGEETYERSVPENSAAGTAVGDPVTATDEDGDDLTYSLISGEDGVPFEVDASTGRITVAADSALNYERGDTLFTLSIEASDGELAATAPVAIRVTNADDPGSVALSPETARVGVEMTATLMDEDGVRSAGRKRRWQRSRNGNSWNDIGTGRMYNPVAGDAGRWLRVVFTYSDRHGPDKRAVSDSVRVLAANATPAFGKDAYERSVPENSAGGTRVGKPVTATDEDGDDLDYVILGEGDGAPFEIDSGTGRIKVAAEATLNYECGDTLFTVRVEATDGELADTASVTIRVKDADDPGEVSLSPGVARVGVELAATLTDEDGVRSAGRKRRWQRSANGNSWTEIATGGAYNPVAADEGRWLRAVFTYRDGHGPGKRAVSDPVKVLPANAKPSFGAAYEREVPENSPGGTKVGAPVAATDPNSPSLSYSLTGDGDDAPFGIDSSTGQITVAEGAALDHESADTLFTVRVEASDGDLADTASVKIRVTNADDPGTIALSADVARVGERLTATLMDEDRSIERSKMRTWQRSPDGATWTMVVQGAQRRFYTPTEADRGKYLRAVFTYTDGHGPGKRAESRAVMVVGATTPVVSFGAGSYTVAAGGSADVGLLLSPAASSALAIKVVAGSSTHTATFQSGAGTASVAIGTTGLSAHDTLAVRFGDLPDGVAVGVPATTRIVVAAVAGDRVSRSVVEDGSPTELEVEYAQAEYAAVAGGPGTEIVLRASPAADRRVAVPITASSEASMEPMLPDSVVFEPGDSLAAFTLEVPAGAEPGLLALGFGALPEAVSAGGVASATVAIADHGPGPLLDGAFDLGLAVLGRAVAEGARQAVGARIDAVMRPMGSGSSKGVPGSASGWAERAAGTLASLTGALLNASSAADMARRSGSVDLPTGREAVRRLLPSLSFATALGPQSAEGRPGIGLWAEGSAQSFRGDPGIDYDGGLRALTVGADARIGSSALLGVSLVRSDGDLDYDHRSTQGSLGHAMNSVHPYVFLQPSPGIGLWAMAGYGSGDVRDGDHHGDPGASLRMLSGGVKVPLARSGAFGLALNGDAFTVGMSTDDGGREGSASRARALLEASWTAGGLKLATQAGARYDGGDADTGGGAETGASVGYAAHGLDLDLRGRLALGSGRHREWGAALRLAFDPGTRGEGFRLAVSPRHGHDRSGIHGLMREGTLHAMTPATGRDWRLDAEAGYGIKNSGAGGALDGYTRLSADGRNRSWSFGSRYSVSQTFRLGIEGSRNQLPGQDPDIGIRVALDFTF
ncbi:MAG: cadherin domain-containing protein [Gammaproteobacteria bacterium]|nr:cadherin domain-containing protein [Gammaproteobacteria bacterium]